MAENADAFHEFLKWEAATNNTIDFKTIYVDIAGDLIAGLMLSQIIYWHLPDKRGESKLRVERDGYLWMVKTRAEWWEECRVTKYQADRALKLLVERGLIETRKMRFNNAPTYHIRLIKSRFMVLWHECVSGANCDSSEVRESLTSGKSNLEVRESPTSEVRESRNSITETTAETTTETTIPEGDAQARAPTGKRKGKSRDPLLDHPAVKAYRDEYHYWPDTTLRPPIAEAVGDDAGAVALWARILRGWHGAGWGPRNIDGMLDWFRRGEIPGTNGKGPPRKHASNFGVKRQHDEYAGGKYAEYIEH